MKTKHLYLILLLVGLSIAGCTANKIRYSKQRQFDKQGRLVYEHVSYKVLRAGKWVLKADTNIHTFYYNADNTLDYLVVCNSYCDTDFTGYVSKYFYQYDSLKNQAEIISVFYKRCADYPIKFRKVYNTKGLLLEDWYWEMPDAVVDSTCNYSPLATGNALLDTSYFTTLQTIQGKRVFEYDKKGKLTGVTDFNIYKKNEQVIVDAYHPARIDIDTDRQYCKMFHPYLYTCEKREKELTITPYLKSLRKLK
jgi:hypothetical protein